MTMDKQQTTDRLKEIKERSDKAIAFRNAAQNPAPPEIIFKWLTHDDGYSEEWSALAANCTDDIPYLLAELDRITAERDEWKRKCEAAVADIEKLLYQNFDDDKCWACSHPFDCGKERRCAPEWRGAEQEEA
jgi:hypothetical protein